MSHWNPKIKFNYQNWYDQKIAQRTKEALAARDTAFAEAHADTPLDELARCLVRYAQALRHTPQPCEVDGGAFIVQRFGSWEAALQAAQLPPPNTEPKLKHTLRYQRERDAQEPLFAAECREKKQQKRDRAQQLRQEQARRRRDEKNTPE